MADSELEGEHSRAFEFFVSVYGTLPRAGPGGDQYTLEALRHVPGPGARTVLDLGCGPGAQTIALARAMPQATIIAVDVLHQMVDEANRRIELEGEAGRVRAVVGDMAEPDAAPGSQDLVWCESAIYNVGITEALQAWRPLLADGGVVVFSEPTWLVDDPPAEIRDWWLAEYPAFCDRAGIEAKVAAAGFRVVATFDLPADAWWDDYYAPMQERIRELRRDHPDDPIADEVASSAEHEIAQFVEFGHTYCYAFFVVEPV
ncbi:MAG: class I SAM-dependent methyltransferase [Acidimicrobiales bacterium]|nr:class I SAM-dependent methyltransferase [Acidimicrobiales bacterium]